MPLSNEIIERASKALRQNPIDNGSAIQRYATWQDVPAESKAIYESDVRAVLAAVGYSQLVEAAKFYANRENWSNDTWDIPCIIGGGEYGDAGRTARAALAALPEPLKVD